MAIQQHDFHLHQHTISSHTDYQTAESILMNVLLFPITKYGSTLYTSGKNNFYEMNGDVRMTGWRLKYEGIRITPAISKKVLYPSQHLSFILAE